MARRTAEPAFALNTRAQAPRTRTRDAAEPASHARAWAEHLLAALDAPYAVQALDCVDEPDVLGWAGSGLMALTGAAQAAPQICPLPLSACADGALAALASLAPRGTFAGLRGAQLLAERAAIAGHERRGDVAPGGSCRLLRTLDGETALNLARESDWELLPAWLEQEVPPGDSAALAASLATRATAALVERGRMLGLALAASPVEVRADAFPVREREISEELRRIRPRVAAAGTKVHDAAGRPLVVDLSALWAGPLCGHLLQRCGAQVIKLESLQRPDGARSGSHAFFDLMNAGKRSVALDFASAQGRAQLRALLLRADIVIESSRPRALRQLGIDAEAIVRERGSTWIGLSGYGRGEPQEHWIAYGDDAGVAAGLSRVMREVTGQSLFVGDALADPLTGIHAALLAWASWRGGGGRLIPLSLAGVTRECLQFDLPDSTAGLRARHRRWTRVWRDHGAIVAAPAARVPAARAAALGEHTEAVLAALGVVPC